MDVRGVSRVALAAALSAVWAGAARADDATEQDLRRQVEELRAELTELKDTVRGGYFTASSDLEARVGELERLAGDATFASTFKNGMRSETADGAFRYQVGGWFQNDWSWFPSENDNEDYDLEAGTNFNAARLYVMGQIYGNVAFKTEYDFSGDEGEFKDVWMEIRNCGFGALRVGHMKEPLGLDTVTDDKFTTFMNRNTVHALMPNRNTGLMVHGTCADDTLLYQVGMFRSTENDHGSDSGSESTSHSFTARVSGRPMVQDDGKTYLHVGVAGSYRDEDDSVDSSSYKPLGSFFSLPTVSAFAEDRWIGAAEVAFVAGPFVAKGEYAHSDVDTGSGGSDVEVDAWAVEAGYWLSGEQWSYSKDAGAFSRPSVKKNFGDENGMGAWQIAARFDTIDPDIDGVDDDDVDSYTVGVNWFVNPNTRVTLNWQRINPSGDPNSFDWIGLRFQLDF
jgi:phosphate-selective porin OprO/OprP